MGMILILIFQILKTKLFILIQFTTLETKTFKYLKEEGRRVFNGLDMFIYRAKIFLFMEQN